MTIVTNIGMNYIPFQGVRVTFSVYDATENDEVLLGQNGFTQVEDSDSWESEHWCTTLHEIENLAHVISPLLRAGAELEFIDAFEIVDGNVQLSEYQSESVSQRIADGLARERAMAEMLHKNIVCDSARCKLLDELSRGIYGKETDYAALIRTICESEDASVKRTASYAIASKINPDGEHYERTMAMFPTRESVYLRTHGLQVGTNGFTSFLDADELRKPGPFAFVIADGVWNHNMLNNKIASLSGRFAVKVTDHSGYPLDIELDGDYTVHVGDGIIVFNKFSGVRW